MSAWEQEVTDPVCGEKFPPELSTFSARYRGMTYHFCSSTCKEKFEDEPEKYARKTKANS